MARYQVILAYDGTDFFGFQRQAEGRTVQSVFESALKKLGWGGRSILAAGRTDSGVHARGQVVAFDLDWAHPPGKLRSALNAYLPPDVSVHAVSESQPDFHPRFDAVARHYRYSIFCQPVRDPLRERYAWRVWPPVEPDALEQAAAALLGQHDFSGFGRPLHPGGSTVRTVLNAGWRKEQAAGYQFDIVANAFLYHMVRRLVQIQVLIGQQMQPLSVLQQALVGSSGEPLQGLAPPNGLVLEAVCFTERINQQV